MTATNERAVAMLKTALEMEEKGYAFYEKAIASTVNPLGKEIFTTLAKDETVHVNRIKSIYERLTGSQDWGTDWQSMAIEHTPLTQIFRDLAAKHGKEITAATSDIEAVDVGIDFEQKSVTFYQDELGLATDPVEKRFIEKMVGEERDHFKALSDLKLYLTDPSAYFTEQEHHGLDG